MVFFKNGQVVNKIEGAMDAQDFQQEIAAFLGSPAAPAQPGYPVASPEPASAVGSFLGVLALTALLAGAGYLVYKNS